MFTIVHPLFTRVFTNELSSFDSGVFLAGHSHEFPKLVLVVVPDVVDVAEPEDLLCIGAELADDADVLAMLRDVTDLVVLH